MAEQAPSRLLVIAAGLLTQLIGAGCLVLSLASLPAAHDLHHGTHAAVGAAVAAVAALIVGALAYGSRPVRPKWQQSVELSHEYASRSASASA